MAAITTRQTAGTGATVAGIPLTNAQLDTNFINLNVDVLNRVSKSGDTLTGTFGVKSVQNFISPNATKTISATMLDSGQLSWSGSAGQLFSITDSLTGTLFSVNDVSGIPSIEILDTGLVKIAQYGGNTLFGTGVDNAADKVQVVGTASIVANGTGTALRVTQTGTGDALRVEDSANPDSTPFVVDASGNTVIGYSVNANYSGDKFNVVGDGGAANVIFSRIQENVNPPTLSFVKSRGASVSSASIVQSGDQLGTIYFKGNDGSGLLPVISAQILAQVDGTPGTNDMPGRLVFSTTADGASTPTERIRIDSSGNVGINDSSPSTRGRLSVIGTGVGRQFVVTAAGLTQAQYNDNGLPNILTLQNHGMTGASQGAGILWTLGNSDANSQNAAAIRILAEGTWDATTASRDSAMAFFTTLDGNMSERLRIDSTGRVGFGGSPYAGTNYYFARNITGATSVDVILQAGTIQSDVISAANVFTSFTGTAASSFTLSNLRHFTAEQSTFGGGSTVTNQYGYQAGATLIGAANNFGFHSNIPSGVGRWNFYAQGNARNLFTGNTGIGADSGNEIKLLVGGNATGATSELGLRISETVLSDVTSSYIGVDSLLSTQAASFTLGGYSAYRAGIGTKGAGSNITTIQGYVALANLAVGTNNYAFRGGFASAANTFNLYMDGTADNYFNSRLLMGRTYSANEKIGIGGSTSAAGESGIYNDTTIGSTTTTAYTAFNSYISTAAASFTLTNLTHYNANQFTIGAGSTVTNQYGFLASNLTGATNNYGFYSNIPAAVGRWNFFANGTAENYFAGSTGVGTTAAGWAKLHVGGIYPSSTNFSIANYANGTIPSTSTTEGASFWSEINTQAATFSTTVSHFVANQGTFGAGSTVTNQHGFRVAPNLTGATNNYGFLSNIASGTGRWNFYAQGTADNYFAGNLMVGGTGTEKLIVVQSADINTARFVNSSTSGALRGLQIHSTANNIPGVTLSRWYSTFAGNADVGQIRFDGLGTGAGYVEYAGIYAVATAANTATGAPTKLSFKTSDGTSSTEKMAVSATGQVSVTATTASTSTTTGALIVAGGVGIAGALNATTKSFIINHPTKPGKLLRHGSLEGPEFGVYVRGRLDNNNMIVLPEYWAKLVDPGTITVNLTPIGSHQELYVENIVNNVVFVKSSNLFNKTINCFYTVFGERVDVDKLEVET